MQLEDGGAVLEGDEVLVAVQQAQAVDSRIIAIAVLVALLQLFTRLLVLAEAHQIDAELGAGRPQLRIRGYGLAVVLDPLQVTPIERQMVSHERVARPVRRVDGCNLAEPLIRSAIGEHFDARVHRHRIQRLRRELQRRVRFGSRLRSVGVLQGEIREQLVGFRQLRVCFERPLRPLDRTGIESVRADQCQPEERLRIPGVPLQGLLEQILCVLVIEPLVQHASPAHSVGSVAIGLIDRRAKLFVRPRVLVQAPKALRPNERARGAHERAEASLRLASVAVLLQQLAAHYGGCIACLCRTRRCGARLLRRRRRGTEHAAAENQDGQRANEPAPTHFSRSSCTFASATNASVSCRL